MHIEAFYEILKSKYLGEKINQRIDILIGVWEEIMNQNTRIFNELFISIWS